jgi:hypothetical protein
LAPYRTPVEALGVFPGPDGHLRRDGPFEQIDLQALRGWAQSADIEDLGAVAEILTSERPNARLQPPMPESERRDFLMRYLGRCIREDPAGEWACARVAAAWMAAELLIASRKSADPDALATIKAWLAQLYLDGDAEVRAAIAVSALERPFRHRDLRRRFADWLDHPELRTAYLVANQQM